MIIHVWYRLPYTVKLLSGKTFVVLLGNSNLWENICSGVCGFIVSVDKTMNCSAASQKSINFVIE